MKGQIGFGWRRGMVLPRAVRAVREVRDGSTSVSERVSSEAGLEEDLNDVLLTSRRGKSVR